jgi:rhodanese-related sulfurtransferase/glyoxylase-like metal-dependent hydrolase (beta-lactamase superfamily II)
MEFKQIYTPGLAQCSYVIGGKNICVVVDPMRDVKPYLEAAKSFGLPIKGIIETHLNAAFVSGHVALSELTGATIYITKQANAAFDHHAVLDEEEFIVDTLKFKMLDTPVIHPTARFTSCRSRAGSGALSCFYRRYAFGRRRGPSRPFPDIKEELASKLYHSLRRIEALADNIELYPAHGAGSLCGKALSSKLSSTIGTEKLHNSALNMHPKESFIKSFLEGMPEAPDHFSRCSEINRKGAPALSKLTKPVGVEPEEFLKLSRSGYAVVDTRDQLAFAAAHIPGAYGLSLKGNFATFSGWVLPPDKPLLLVLEEADDMPAVLKALYNVGLDNVQGYLAGGMAAYASSGLETARIESISVFEARKRYEKGEIYLVDTRLKSEWDSGHIQCTVHIPAPDVRRKYKDLMGTKPVAFICNSGNRSLLASSLMLNLSDRKDVINVIGGTTAWTNLGYPTVKENEDEFCTLPLR